MPSCPCALCPQAHARPSADKASEVLAAGHAHTAALSADGLAWAWGYNAHGQLGIGSTEGQNRPVRVKSDEKFVALAAGHWHTVALSADGLAWAWGDNGHGQLGIGSTEGRNLPQLVLGQTLNRSLWHVVDELWQCFNAEARLCEAAAGGLCDALPAGGGALCGGAVEAVLCSAGTYCPGGFPLQCPAGHFCASG